MNLDKLITDKLDNSNNATVEIGPLTVSVKTEYETESIFFFDEGYGSIHHEATGNRGEECIMYDRCNKWYWTYPEDLQQNGKSHKAFPDYEAFLSARRFLRERVEAYFREEWFMMFVTVSVSIDGIELGVNSLGMVESGYVKDAITDYGMVTEAMADAKKHIGRIVSSVCRSERLLKVIA